ncbi:PAS domain S-box protein [Desulfofundulus thermosubterraneus]|uniref:Stage 0 sporulation protein A homolog n=1 Tax=Desulfofundulus thermosubterraneus DSM 16057 TaxID=1121432 RepID=A0A1M6LEG1_9FIRM|nr:PAS domain S-box protein [Desulfofundulus thermosubterraneus]SHJ69556.1 PAS domain S-box-containing protein/diguanylate cyclase (GGDEF) domain-containing protein [Desulfofundulus thermosubterraneus DSM 16057]
MKTFKGKRILIVEDSRFLAQITANILNKYGYVTEIALTGEEAVEKVRGSRCPDLILMDIELGEGMDGALAARTIQQFRDVPVVFLTAHTQQEVVEKIRSVTGYGYVLKGAGEHVLVSTVEMALRLYEANAHANMYRRIFEDSLNEIYIFHPETLKFIAVNRGARENLGYTIEELSNMTPLDLKPELDLQSFRELLDLLVRGEQEKIVFNTVHRRKDGSLYPVEVHLQLFEHDGEKVCLALVIDLSERRRMEEELREREATLSAVMGSARDAIVMLDGQGNVTFWNPAAEQLFGYSREEILGKELHRLVVPEENQYQAYREGFQRFQLTGEGNAIGKTIELKAKHKDGRELDVELSLSALKIRDAWHAVGIVRDISERKRLEEENRRKEERLRQILEGIPSPAWLVSRDRRILAQNKAAEMVVGTKVGNYCWRSIHGTKSLPDECREAIEKSGTPLPGTKCYFCRGDEALDKNAPINSEVEFAGGIWDTWWVPLGEDIYLHYAVDVTKYKKMEEDLRQREEYLNLLLTSMPVGIITVDALSHRIEDVNQEAAALMGAPPEAIIGKTCFEFFSCPKGCCPVKDLGEEVDRAERILRRADGTQIPVLKTVRRLQTESGEKLIENFMDLTDRKKMEEELRCLSITDPLTNAYNRRYFMQVLEQEIERTRRTGLPFSIIMVDLDHFKSINDRFGHAAGDRVLKSLVDMIKQRIRKTDCLARWGGEEFIILLPNTPVDKAAGLAEELRERLSRMDIPGVGHVTASFGVAGYCPPDTADTLIMRADNTLYAAKAAGRNCVRYTGACI